MRALAPVLILLCGCGSSLVPDAARELDAAPTHDAGRDAPSASLDAPVAPTDAGPRIALGCADVHGSLVCSGVADPSALGAGIEPVRTGLSGGGEPGAHWYCRPADASTWTGTLVVHLVGTYSDPRDDHRFAERACSLGHAAIAPMYEDRDNARSVCGDDEDCYEGFHVEVVDGVEASPVEVDADDALTHRAGTLLDALATDDAAFSGWAALATELREDGWPSVIVSGHSQGAGHALYLAREHELSRLVLLAGPSDQVRDGEPDHAPPPWITGLSAVTATPVDRFYAFIHLDDSLERIPQVFASYDAMGLGRACDFASAAGYASDCRRILVPSDECLGLSAHLTVVSLSWGPMCRIGDSGHESPATWAFLLE